MNCPAWDGIVNYEDIDRAAKFLATHAKNGPVLVHCAHGVGRSTTVMRAALVQAGVCDNINDAYQLIKNYRPIAQSSKRNQALLERWEKSRK
mmetsp:Transcript_13020/g.14925  ORF Transcript_13020/g.14925 Transcript_13020/m.14925 type:complete len:92 (+) Transcript_13020:47-322(+)